MPTQLVIHGHFYQPPREDPWLDHVLPEGSAAPANNWNERIADESYGPLAQARRLDAQGRITEIVNCFEWMSFNAGPTLMAWLASERKDIHDRLVQADKASTKRWGHGNAVAQVAHHIIMPLASPLDKEIEVAWGKADFMARFGREPEGMWLAETAADTASMEAMAAQGITFTILAPRQAKAVRLLSAGRHGEWHQVDEGNLDLSHSYAMRLPSGKTMTVFFYDGPISQAVAFERLLADGETFWRRISAHAPEGLRALATDGETYGHHFEFGEMALAYVLEQARNGRDGICLTNFAAHMAAHPPQHEVKLHEPSSWSCVHGVERWRSDCGCTTDGRAGWNQKWRTPLRRALDVAKDRIDRHFFARGQELFVHPRTALLKYGEVLAGTTDPEAFIHEHCSYWLAPAELETAWALLAMQRWAVSSFASCAWFFEDIHRIEPINAMSMMLRAMELAVNTGMSDPVPEFTAALEEAHSNRADGGNGAEILRTEAQPRQESTESLACQALLRLWAEDRIPKRGKQEVVKWHGVKVAVEPDTDSGRYVVTASYALGSGRERSRVRFDRSSERDPWSWAVHLDDGRSFAGHQLSWGKQQVVATAWVHTHAAQVSQEQKRAAALGPAMFTPFQVAQSTQTAAPAWASLLPGLYWSYLNGTSEIRNGDLLEYFRTDFSTHPAWPLLAGQTAKHLLHLLNANPRQAAGCLERLRDLGLRVNLFEVQNRAWADAERVKNTPGLWELLGFAG